MPHVVKILFHDDGEQGSDKWHYVFDCGPGKTAFCSGEFFGSGESSVIYEEKEGRITCDDCIAIIKKIKAVKL